METVLWDQPCLHEKYFKGNTKEKFLPAYCRAVQNVRNIETLHAHTHHLLLCVQERDFDVKKKQFYISDRLRAIKQEVTVLVGNQDSNDGMLVSSSVWILESMILYHLEVSSMLYSSELQNAEITDQIVANTSRVMDCFDSLFLVYDQFNGINRSRKAWFCYLFLLFCIQESSIELNSCLNRLNTLLSENSIFPETVNETEHFSGLPTVSFHTEPLTLSCLFEYVSLRSAIRLPNPRLFRKITKSLHHYCVFALARGYCELAKRFQLVFDFKNLFPASADRELIIRELLDD